jgi:hypothetical protein
MGDGTSLPVSIQDFSVMFSNSNIDGSTGTTTMSAVAMFTAGRAVLPILIDSEAGTTTRIDSDEWKLKVSQGVYDFIMLSDNRIALSGDINYAGGIIKINATINKAGQQSNTTVQNMASILNGTWATSTAANAQNGGGFMITTSGTFYVGTEVFASLVFSDTTSAADKTTCTGTGFMKNATMSGEEGLVLPISMIGQEIPITHMFANYYKFNIENRMYNMEGLFVLRSESSASLIVQASNQIGELHTLFTLEKKPANDNLNLAAYIPSSWSVDGGGTSITSGQIVPLAASEGFTVSLVSADASGNVSLTLSGDFTVPGTSTKAREYRGTPEVFAFRHIGYNTIHAVNDSNVEVHNLIMTIISQNYAVLSDVAAGSDESIATLTGHMTKKR